MSDEKMWGEEPFWGLGYEWDPDWVLTDRQKELRATLIELCETGDCATTRSAPTTNCSSRGATSSCSASTAFSRSRCPRSTAASARTTSRTR